MSAHVSTPTFLREPEDTETRVWLAAEALYREQCPHRGRLILAKRTVRSKFVRLALKAVTAWTDRHGASWDAVRHQAAVDYATHAACARVPDPLRYAEFSREGQ